MANTDSHVKTNGETAPQNSRQQETYIHKEINTHTDGDTEIQTGRPAQT